MLDIPYEAIIKSYCLAILQAVNFHVQFFFYEWTGRLWLTGRHAAIDFRFHFHLILVGVQLVSSNVGMLFVCCSVVPKLANENKQIKIEEKMQ